MRPLFLLLLPAMLAAHDLTSMVTLAAPAVIVRSVYGGSEPVAFAKVQVFAPGGDSTQHQAGSTDRRGVFSFVPDGPGVWRVVVDDEEGHRAESSVDVPANFSTGAVTVGTQPSRLERALLGVALMVGLTGFLYGFKARKRS
jgi:nickel transport protein